LEDISKNIDNGTLDLKGKVITRTIDLETDLIPITTLQSLLKKLPSETKSTIVTLDLSNNNLVDQDLKELLPLVLLLPNCKRLVLSGNRFHGYERTTRLLVDQSLLQLLNTFLEWVDITGNPVASMDRQDLFRKLKAKQLLKLIWIPEGWLAGSAWHTLVRPTHYADVQRMHKQYYSQC